MGQLGYGVWVLFHESLSDWLSLLPAPRPLHISSLPFVPWGRGFVLSLGVEEQQEDCGIPHFAQVVAQFCSPEFCLCL